MMKQIKEPENSWVPMFSMRTYINGKKRRRSEKKNK